MTQRTSSRRAEFGLSCSWQKRLQLYYTKVGHKNAARALFIMFTPVFSTHYFKGAAPLKLCVPLNIFLKFILFMCVKLKEKRIRSEKREKLIKFE